MAVYQATRTMAPASCCSAARAQHRLRREKYVGGIQNNGTLRYAAPPRQYGLRVGMDF